MAKIRSVMCGIGLTAVSAASAIGCGSGAAEEVGKGASAVAFGGVDIAWQRIDDGSVSVWLDNGQTPLVTQALDTSVPSGWSVVDTGGPNVGANLDSSILFFNKGTGQLSFWRFDNNGSVFHSLVPETSSSPTWRPVGQIGFKQSCAPGIYCPVAGGVLWDDASTGDLAVWSIDAATGAVTPALMNLNNPSFHCDATCHQSWSAILTKDFNSDGNSDILWYNASTGQVSVWTLDSTGRATGSFELERKAPQSKGWNIVGAADVNGDGNTDLLWFNPTTGQLSNWLLDEWHDVMGMPILPQTCGVGCSSSYVPMGYVTFPQSQPK